MLMKLLMVMMAMAIVMAANAVKIFSVEFGGVGVVYGGDGGADENGVAGA